MLHLFLDSRPWFRPKRYGYGAGLPIAWQGWVLLLSYVAVVIGLGLLSTQTGRAVSAALAGALTLGFVLIVRARTAGGWRWRWGEDT